ncbi:MAG: PAS domain S-box protein [Pseudolabrys sp.]|nr:PAS domain S-box protein [Pseudolabrys sp.]
MTGSMVQLGWLSDPRLSAHALSASPVWLWSTDARTILWANASGAAIFDASTPGQLDSLLFEPTHPAAAQIKRLSGTLPHGAAPRLERLRGFGASLGGPLTCLCSRLSLSDNASGVLVVATERAGKELSLPERARRILADIAQPAAMFTADGELIEASASARDSLGQARDLIALGATSLAREASVNGNAEGDIPAGRIALLKLGANTTVALLLVFVGRDKTANAAPRATEAATAVAAADTSRANIQAHAHLLPFRFVWQMDASMRFTLGNDDFARLLGPKTAAAVLGRPWDEIAETLQLDPQGQIADALTERATWSGVVVHWPVDDFDERLAVEMSGLPVSDRNREFEGFRGFGVCRDLDRLTTLEQRRLQPPTPAPEPIAPPVVPQAEEPTPNVLAFRSPPLPTEAAPELSPGEHSAFQELARELNARLKNAPATPAPTDAPDDFGTESAEPYRAPEPPAPPLFGNGNGNGGSAGHNGRPILDRLPVGILVYRLNNLIYANRAFLDWTGYDSLEALAEAGGLDSLFIETKNDAAPDNAHNDSSNGSKTLSIATVNGQQKPVEGKLFSVGWSGENALVLMINTQPAPDDRSKGMEASLRRIESENHELKAVLDTATDGVLVLDRVGRVLSANRSAEALFGYEAADLLTLTLGDLFAPESRRGMVDYLDRLARANGGRMLDAGREAIGRVRQGGLVPLYVTMGRIEDGEKLCVVLRDITAWKRTEEELINARQQAERASTAKSEFLAKISHEIRTPLNAIIGFSEVMMDERFGAIGNERYKQYLKDIHASGGHLISLVNDLLDLSKIEAGKLELSFVSVNLNDLVQQCVALMQQQANQDRVIIRTSLPPNLPPIVADVRSVRQIALNLLSNSIKFTGAGGQVIVSTAVNDDHEVSLRVRDTGVGMSENELQTALEPFRQIATATRRSGTGTGLGLPITKALAEANHARFRISSQVDDGTLVEVAFPATRVLAQ